jgi:hypothetical protein
LSRRNSQFAMIGLDVAGHAVRAQGASKTAITASAGHDVIEKAFFEK